MADGSLMGWNPLQRSLDRNALKTDKLISSVEKLVKHLGEVAKAGAQAGAASWRQSWSTMPPWPGWRGGGGSPAGAGSLGSVSAIQAMYNGKGLGGHAKNPGQGYGVALAGAGGQPAQVGLKGGHVYQGGQPASAQPSLLMSAGNGGHGTSGVGTGGGGGVGASLLSQFGNGGLRGNAGRTAALVGVSTLMAGVGSLKNFGDQQMQGQMLMELGARSASFSTPGSYTNASRIYRDTLFGRSGVLQQSGYAMSREDAMAADAMRRRITGGFIPNTMRDLSVDQAYKSLAMINPTMSAEQGAGAMADLLSPRVQNNARWLGVGEMFNSNHAYIGNAKLMQQLFKVTFGTTKPSERRVSHSLSQGQALFHNMGQLGIGAETFGAMSEYARAYAKATSAGLDGNKLDEMLVRAAGSGPAAKATQEELTRYGIPVDTLLHRKKEIAGIDRASDAQLHEQFIDEWKKATDEVKAWRLDMSKLRENKTYKDILALGGALAELWNNPGSILEIIKKGWNGPPGTDPTKPRYVERNGKKYELRTMGAPDEGSFLDKAGQWFESWLDGFKSDKADQRTTHIRQQGGAGVDEPMQMAAEAGSSPKGSIAPPAAAAASGGNSAKTEKKPKNRTDRTDADNKKSRNKSDKESGATGQGINAVIAYARAQIGKWYQLGAEGPDRFDCSGLVQSAYKYGAHKNLPRTTWDQINVGQPVPINRKAAAPGDLIFTEGGGHVVLWAGNSYISAPGKGRRIYEGHGWPKGIVGIRRILGSSAKGWYGAGTEDGNLPTMDAGQGGDEASGDPITGNVLAGLANSLGSIEEKDIFEAIFGKGDGIVSLHGGAGTGAHITSGSDAKAAGKSGGKGTKSGKREKLPPPPKNTSARSNIKLGKKMASRMGWSGGDWNALYQLWMRESNWNHLAKNPGSGAYGIPQSMPGNKMASEGPDWQTNPETQIRWGLKYIKGRYGDPEGAWRHWQARVPINGKDVGHWYDKGAWEIKADTKAVVHKGEMIIPSKQADTIREVLTRENVQSAGRLTRGGGGTTFGDINVNVNVRGGGGGASFDTHAAARQLARQLKIELAQLDSYEATARGR